MHTHTCTLHTHAYKLQFSHIHTHAQPHHTYTHMHIHTTYIHTLCVAIDAQYAINEQMIVSIFGLRPESWSSVQEFLKQLPTYGLEPVDCGSLILDAPQIAAIEKAVLDMQVCVWCVLCVYVCVCVRVCVCVYTSVYVCVFDVACFICGHSIL